MYQFKINVNNPVYRLNSTVQNNLSKRPNVNTGIKKQNITFTSALTAIEENNLKNSIPETLKILSERVKNLLKIETPLEETINDETRNISLKIIPDNKNSNKYFLDVEIFKKGIDPKLADKFSRYLAWGSLQEILSSTDDNFITKIVKTINDGIKTL